MPLPKIIQYPVTDSVYIEFYSGSVKYSKKSEDSNLLFDYDKDKRLIAVTRESVPVLVKRYSLFQIGKTLIMTHILLTSL